MTDAGVSIAVLPFENLSVAEEAGHFAAGFAEDLIACLTRFTPLRVVFLSGQSDARAQLERHADEWEVDVVLRGSVRVRARELRVSAQLISLPERQTVWSDRFDSPLDGVFAIQDEIVSSVAARLAVSIEGLQLARARRGGRPQLAAYELWLQGMECLKRGSLEGDAESRPYFRRSLEADPHYARGHSGLSLSHFNEWSCQAWHLWDESADNACLHAEKAAELDENDAMVQAVLGRVFRYRHEHPRAETHTARALSLNPNDPSVLIHVAISTLFGGRPAEARGLVERAMRLAPLHPPWFAGIAGWCLFMEGDHAAALPLLEQGGDWIINFVAYRAACLLAAGEARRGRAAYEEFENLYRERITFGRPPGAVEAVIWAIQVEPFRDLEDSRLMPDVLRQAGLIEVDVAAARSSRARSLVRPANLATSGENAFTRQGRIWTVDYEGSGAQLTEVKGFHDIVRLLAAPGVCIHCLELTGTPPEPESRHAVLDSEAREAYRRRIEDLQEELDRAESDNDPARHALARQELDTVFAELARATGLGGRPRELYSRAERARSAVTWRIRSAIRKIQAAHPRLGQHLANSIRTGAFCVYEPEAPVNWRL